MNIFTLGLAALLSISCVNTPKQTIIRQIDKANATTEVKSVEDIQKELDDFAEALQNDPSCTDGVRDYPFPEAYIQAKAARISTMDAEEEYDDLMTCMNIAAYFSNVDGLPATALLAIEAEGRGAKIESTEWVSDGFITETYRDSARHFLWNFRSVKNVLATVEETRIFTINHEWANILKEDYESHLNKRKELYLAWGYDEETSESLADADADDYVLALKQQKEALCRENYSYFSTTFNPDNIMDLHNNIQGRSYADNYFWWGDSTKKTAYSNALNNGDICIDKIYVTETIRSNIYYNLNNWYIG